MPSAYGPLLPYLIPLLLLIFVVRRSLRARTIKIERMWVMPVVLIVLGLSIFAAGLPTDPLVLAGLAAAIVVGAALGWWRGKLTHITIDPETHDLTSRASPLGVMLIAALFALRYVSRVMLLHGGLGGQAQVVAATDALTLLGIATLSVQRLEMWLRCRKLLEEARAAKATS